MARAIADDSLQRLHAPAELDSATRLATRLGLIDTKAAGSYRADACALAGDFDGAVSALGLTRATLA